MAFRDHLAQVCAGVDGSVACSVIGFDGIAVETVESRSTDLDIPTLLIEYTTLLNQVRAAAGVLQSGQIHELAISTDRLTAISRPLNDDYFVVLALAPEANQGKARYLLRIAAPELQKEL